ncbi:MAG: slipin family protein [Candidatus Micrarchaeota archaeon]
MADDLTSFCCGPGVLSLLLLGFFVGLPFILSAVRVIQQYENGVIFRLGRKAGVRGPGLTFLIPVLDAMRIVDMRIQSLDIPKQETLTKDNISAFLNAVVYYRIADPEAAILKVQDYKNAIFQHGQAAMRDIAGSVELDSLLYEREKVALEIQQAVSKETKGWGIEIISINIQDIELPTSMKRAMARQAQAERDKRATVIISIGEVEAAGTMAEAAKVISSSPGAVHLRTLQALSNLSADKTNTITYLLPIEGQSLSSLEGTDRGADLPEPKVTVAKKEIKK